METVLTAADKMAMRSVNLCKSIMENMKTFEERLVKLEINQLKDCVLKKPFDEQIININNTYNTLEEMISSNTENVTKIEDDLRNIKK